MYNLEIEIQDRIKNIEPIFLEEILSSYPGRGLNYDCNIKETIKSIKKKLFSNNNLKPHTIDYWTSRGWSEIDAEKLRLKRNKKWYLDTFGLIDGNERWNNYTKSHLPKSQKQIKRNDRKVNQISKIKGKFKNTLDNYIQIYGKKLGEIKYKDFCEKSSHPSPNKGNRMTLNDYTNKYGKIEGYSKYLKRTKINCAASKGSLKLFLPLIDLLNNICKDDIIIGYNGQKEKRLFYNNNKNWYWYDFTIESKKKIIEYNGLKYHKDEKRDLHKIKIAEDNGYEILTLWSSTKLNTNIELALKFINDEK